MGAIAGAAALALLVSWVYAKSSTSRVRSRLERAVAAHADSFDFAADAKFEWDRMFVFEPYTSREMVEKAIGTTWPGYRLTSIENNDGITLVLFMKSGSVAAWYQQPRFVDLCEISNPKGWDRSEAKFAIVHMDGRAVLRRLTTPAHETASADSEDPHRLEELNAALEQADLKGKRGGRKVVREATNPPASSSRP